MWSLGQRNLISRFTTAITLGFTTITTASASALVAPPIVSAAEAMGFRMVGEVEYDRGKSTAPPRQVARNAQFIKTNCVSTNETSPPIRVVVMSWSDHEYPSARYSGIGVVARRLADARGTELARNLRRHLAAPLRFDLVNMASRLPRATRPGRRSAELKSRDIKMALVDAGAAPTSPWEIGLFGEYAQASKSAIWVDCDPAISTQRTARLVPAQELLLVRE